MYGEGRNDGEPYTITLVNDELAGKKGKKKYFISFTHFSVNFSKYNMKKKKLKVGRDLEMVVASGVEEMRHKDSLMTK